MQFQSTSTVNTSRHLIFLIFNVVVSVFIAAMLWLGGGKINGELMLFLMAICIVLTKAGELACSLGGLTTIKSGLLTAFVIGFVVISVPMTALSLLFRISAAASFLIVALTVAFLIAFLLRKISEHPQRSWGDIAITFILTLSIALLAKIPVSSAETLLVTGSLPIWNDYFIHGVTIASFGSPFATGFDMELAGVSRIFYHYAPFVIPAAIQPVSKMSGLALSTSLLLPLGLLIAAFGSYSFAVELGGRRGGLLALTAIICLPAYLFFIQSGWFDFYWLLFIAPGSGYAIGVSAIVCASLHLYCERSDIRLLWLMILLLASLILIRVHMFMLLAPAVFTVLIAARCFRSFRPIFFGGAGLAIAGIFALYFSTNLQRLWVELSNPFEYLNSAMQWTKFYGLEIQISEYPILKVAIQLFIVLVSVLGIYLILYPAFFLLTIQRFGFREIDALPIFILLSFVGLTLFAPIAGNGDISEYKHRHFLLLYSIIAIYTISYAHNVIAAQIPSETRMWEIVSVLSMCVFLVTISLGWHHNPASPNVRLMPWAAGFHDQRIHPGTVEAAEYIKAHSVKGDVFAMDVVSLGATLDAPAVEVISLSGVPAFVARPALKSKGSECARNISAGRVTLLQDFLSIDNWSNAKKFLRDNGVRWFLIPSEYKVKWDPDIKEAVFSNSGYSIYDAGNFSNEPFEKAKC